MPKEDVKTTVKKTIIKTITEHVVKWFVRWVYLIIFLGVGNVSIISFKKRLVQHPAFGEISFWLLLTTVTVAVVMLVYTVRMYCRYGRLKEDFGVFWDKNYHMRCLRCKSPIKYSSRTDASMLYCSKCNCKHILKDANGQKLSPQEAINYLKQGSKDERRS